MNNLVPFSKVDLLVEMFDKEWRAQQYTLCSTDGSPCFVDGAIFLFHNCIITCRGFLLG